jgi:hypothetical protein
MHGEVNARALPVSNVVDHSQKVNVAARAKAEKKTEAVRDRVNGAIRAEPKPFSPPTRLSCSQRALSAMDEWRLHNDCGGKRTPSEGSFRLNFLRRQ